MTNRKLVGRISLHVVDGDLVATFRGVDDVSLLSAQLSFIAEIMAKVDEMVSASNLLEGEAA